MELNKEKHPTRKCEMQGPPQKRKKKKRCYSKYLQETKNIGPFGMDFSEIHPRDTVRCWSHIKGRPRDSVCKLVGGRGHPTGLDFHILIQHIKVDPLGTPVEWKRRTPC